MKRYIHLSIAAFCVASVANLFAEEPPAAPAGKPQEQKKSLGYEDTPLIPGQKWHIHDGTRPQPKVITPGEKPGDAPSDAIILFDGKDLSKWASGERMTIDGKGGSNGEPTKWIVRDGYFECVPKSGYIFTRDAFGPDVQLHVEWAAPSEVKGNGQGRGNSGVFFYGGLYEVQVLDCFNNPTYPDGQASALYGQWPPLVNASRKPGEWQTYDIIFEGPRWEGEKLISPAYATVIHNGVIVQNHRAYFGPTNHKQILPYTPHAEKGSLSLQDHGNPVRYRNVWIRELKPVDSE